VFQIVRNVFLALVHVYINIIIMSFGTAAREWLNTTAEVTGNVATIVVCSIGAYMGLAMVYYSVFAKKPIVTGPKGGGIIEVTNTSDSTTPTTPGVSTTITTTTVSAKKGPEPEVGL
jgi:hypothetical protein